MLRVDLIGKTHLDYFMTYKAEDNLLFAIMSLRNRELVALLCVLAVIWLSVFCVFSYGVVG